ncbi:interleukin-12 subunit beta [Lampris incognitus]|uniref:interleukin-12 subunit beta n=1 Tax=Lampris incognitus TaxID=2546036 RepID=UPI0024B55ABC|nr:interleukin-12 subunit beta [Lampris incognitus]
MRVLLLVVLCAVLQRGSQQNVENIMNNVLALRVPHGSHPGYNVPLTCGETYESQPVFWKKNGKQLSSASRGNQISVYVEEMDGGNYTCHLGRDGPYLNHTLVLVQVDPDNKSVILERIHHRNHGGGYVYCSAHNYNGSFQCTWKRTPYRSEATVLSVTAKRDSSEISCEVDAGGSGMHCQDPGCPFKEEQRPIFLTIYIYNVARLEAYNTNFYLRDIVRPEQVSNLQHKEGGVFSWDYPESWQKPCTYFCLQFQVKVVRRGETCDSNDLIEQLDNTDKMNYKVRSKAKRFVFCVRAQDKFTDGPWSEWRYHVVKKATG